MRKLLALRQIGPGIVIAATGLGAGDMVTAAASGAEFGSLLLWAVIAGAIIKLALNEGLARWQLSAGSSLLSGWNRFLPRWVAGYFFIYLIIWSFLVAAALMAACGLAAHALIPSISVTLWAAIQSIIAALLIAFGRYQLLENLMKWLIGLMFITVMVAVFAMDLNGLAIAQNLIPSLIPDKALNMLLAVLGGVGGSVTLLCYGYWMREKGWQGTGQLSLARWDLTVAYSLTALFAMGIMLLAAKASPSQTGGLAILLGIADALGKILGENFRLLFLVGFWAAVFSSMLGVWQGVPYLFADTLKQWQSRGRDSSPVEVNSKAYRNFLVFLALPPLTLLLFGKPVWLVLLYSVTGAFFMPFLALALLYLNNRKLAKPDRNGLLSNSLLLVALLLFVAVGAVKLL
ncbi:Mn2+/Fe2- transporter, NRAMP family [Spongiibacter sp. IMCC21906]|uniref:Nramp family divalent metal transporter n=1 Tax=Spongiibacter sp. IMCC21906 TaxID=1620392 RepID=UPI00062DDF20|nr:Nramp family divalent metal transporter [Spongiibacter sp. IMCC21906]AKH68445.1 Mn2+/Fe2- transporter, NRAMP family [Spongiibacter sp. IMCC21906]